MSGRFSKNVFKQQNQQKQERELKKNEIGNLKNIRIIEARQNDPTKIQISQKMLPQLPLPTPQVSPSTKIMMSPVEYLEYVAAQEEFAPPALTTSTPLSTSTTISPSTDAITLTSINNYPHELQKHEIEFAAAVNSSTSKIPTFHVDNEQYYDDNLYPSEINPHLQEQFSNNNKKITSTDEYPISTKRNSLPLSPLDEMKNQIVHLNSSISSLYYGKPGNPQIPQGEIQQGEISQGELPQGEIPQGEKQKQKMSIYQYYRPNENNDNELDIPLSLNNNDIELRSSPSTSNNNSNNNSTTIINRDNITLSTPSPLTLPGLTKNRSRYSLPRLESVPKIQTGCSARVQSSNSPLRQEFRKSDISIMTARDNDNDEFQVDYDYFFLNPEKRNDDYYLPHRFRKDNVLSMRDSIESSSSSTFACTSNPIMQTDSFERKGGRGIGRGGGGDLDDPLLNNLNNNNNNTRIDIDIDNNDQDYSLTMSRGIQMPKNVYIPKNQRKKYIRNNIVEGRSSEFQGTREANDVTQRENDEKDLKAKKPKQGTFFLFIGILIIGLMIIILFIVSKRLSNFGTFNNLINEVSTIHSSPTPTSTSTTSATSK